MINDVTDYLSTTSLIPLDSVLRPEIQKKFERLPDRGVIFLGYDPHYYWYRFSVSNKDSTAKDLVLLLGGLGIRKAQIWTKKNGQWSPEGITGYQYPLSERPYRYAHPAFPLKVDPASIDTFLIKTDESHAYKSISFILVDATTMKMYAHRFYFIMGIIIGLLLLFVLFNLYLFSNIKENIHVWYGLYILMMVLFIIKDEGLDPEFLGLDSSNGYRMTSMLAIAGLAIGFLLQMVQSFLVNTTQSKVLYKSMSYLKWFLFLMGSIQFIVFYIQPSNTIELIVFHITNKAGVVAILLIIIACIYSFRQGFKPALFLLAGQLLFLTGVVLRGLFIGMERHVFPPSVFEVGLIAEVIIISYGLMYRYNQYKKEKEKLSVELQKEKIYAAKEILNTQEREQKRIAADLHDELGGNLAAIKMTLQSFHLPIEQAETMNYLIDKASNNARHIAHNLMPPEFENTNLEVLLDKFYQRINTEGKINFNFYYSGKNNRFNKQEDLVIYRIIMELTNNIINHSHATEATIQLIYHEKQMTLMAEDNGKGIRQDTDPGMGLKNVRSRVNFLNGSMNIDSGNGGTTIMIQIPFKEA
jgi:signal transduction histidine kinase